MLFLPTPRNDGSIKINGTTQAGATVKPSWVLAADVERRINLPYPAFPLAKSGFPTTSWPPNSPGLTDSDLVVDTAGVTSFLENGIPGQVHLWRLAFLYTGKTSGADAVVKCRIFNEYNGSTFNISTISPTGTGASTTSGTLLFNLMSIADNVSLPAPISNGFGYSFAVKSSHPMTITLDHITRVSQHYATPRSI
ncbi:MAG: hypothetical protein ACRC7C_19645 [Beijerinckiaceae bacterium]